MLLGVLFALLTMASAGPVCRAIALQGGGSHGGYEAGVIWALTNLSIPSDITWNICSGISVGAINTGGMAQFAPGNEAAMADFLLSIWRSVNGTSDVLIPWSGGLIDGLLFHSGLYDSAPLVRFLTNNFLYGIQRNFSIGSTNLDTGLFATFNESLGAASINSVLCSSAYPPVFPTQQLEGYTWADGGIIDGLDVFSAVERCLEVTSEDSVVLDLVFDTFYTPLANDTKLKTLEVFERAREIKAFDSAVWYTYNAMIAYPKATFRHIIHPTQPLPNGGPYVPLNFTPAAIEFEIQLGINDTKAEFLSTVPKRTMIQELFLTKNSVFYP
jgi:predicted acylesterase/phospholipase RssA